MLGDFNGDGIADLEVVFIGGVRVLLGNGDGTFLPTPTSYVAGVASQGVAVANFNGDGVPDQAVANFTSDDVGILLNDGNWPAGADSRAGHPTAEGPLTHGPVVGSVRMDRRAGLIAAGGAGVLGWLPLRGDDTPTAAGMLPLEAGGFDSAGNIVES